MEGVEFVKKVEIKPTSKGMNHHGVYLSNIDLTLVTYHETVTFFNPPEDMTFLEVQHSFCKAIQQLLVPYDFLGGKLVSATDEGRCRLKICCNDPGIIVHFVTIDHMLCEHGDLLLTAGSDLHMLLRVGFVYEKVEWMEIEHQPISIFQLSKFKCGSLALTLRYNHCAMDGVSAQQFLKNLGAMTHGDNNKMFIIPNPDRRILKGRNPPIVTHPHLEFSKHRRKNFANHQPEVGMVHITGEKIENLKEKVGGCTSFEAVAAKVWKARATAVGMKGGEMSTMLFPVNIRRRLIPSLDIGFVGNAVIPGYARRKGREVVEECGYEDLVKEVQSGVRRVDEEYIRSAIDWLEVNEGGVRCGGDGDEFSVVEWCKLGLDDVEFGWGKVKRTVILSLLEGFVLLLPEYGEGRGVHVCFRMTEKQIQTFREVINEE